LHRAAADAAAGQQYPAATLYVVATPIGNLADITLRAVHVLGLVDAVACEDTRVGGSLLRHLGLSKPLLALHAHNEHQAASQVLARLARGERIAYVSDAGTPAVSDPGALLVAACVQAGHRCVPLPGASSALAALSVAGDGVAGPFRVVGFLGARGGIRRSELERVAALPDTQVLFEAPHRITQLAAELASHCGARPVTVARELTKQFESVQTMPAAELPAWLAADANRQRGEFVVVLHALPPADPGEAIDDTLRRWLEVLLGELPLKQAAALAAAATGLPRKAVYALALQLRAQADADVSDADDEDGGGPEDAGVSESPSTDQGRP
jgi:16S rRNA (cytidine1402-2'-O)-methyltransferase